MTVSNLDGRLQQLIDRGVVTRAPPTPLKAVNTPPTAEPALPAQQDPGAPSSPPAHAPFKVDLSKVWRFGDDGGPYRAFPDAAPLGDAAQAMTAYGRAALAADGQPG